MNDKCDWLIVSLSHTSTFGKYILLFWGENQSGYASNLKYAGLYTRAEADKICRGHLKEDTPMHIGTIGLDLNSIAQIKAMPGEVLHLVEKSNRIIEALAGYRVAKQEPTP